MGKKAVSPEQKQGGEFAENGRRVKFFGTGVGGRPNPHHVKKGPTTVQAGQANEEKSSQIMGGGIWQVFHC